MKRTYLTQVNIEHLDSCYQLIQDIEYSNNDAKITADLTDIKIRLNIVFSKEYRKKQFPDAWHYADIILKEIDRVLSKKTFFCAVATGLRVFIRACCTEYSPTKTGAELERRPTAKSK